MRSEKKLMIRFYTITDYEKEEVWLSNMHRQGLKPLCFVPPCFYLFEKCEPAEMIYRLELRNTPMQEGDYMQMLHDYGWEYLFTTVGWCYYRKPAGTSPDGDELFSDNASKLAMIRKIFKQRMLPLLIVFFLCVMPQIPRFIFHNMQYPVLFIIYTLLFAIYIFLFVHCGIGFYNLHRKYGKPGRS